MPRYMLDTDTCSYVMKRSQPLVLERLQILQVGDVCMSVVTKAELLYGVEVSPRRAQDTTALEAFLPYVEVLELDEDAALHYADIRAGLKKRGATIGANDLFIAAHARALRLTLVTNNTAEFQRVPRLVLENWTLPVGGSDRVNHEVALAAPRPWSPTERLIRRRPPAVLGRPSATGGRTSVRAWARRRRRS